MKSMSKPLSASSDARRPFGCRLFMTQICIVLVPELFHDLYFVPALLGREACRVGNPVPFVVLAFLGKLVLVEVAPICEDILEEQTPSLPVIAVHHTGPLLAGIVEKLAVLVAPSAQEISCILLVER